MHPQLGSSVGALALLHVLAAFVFVLLHGPSVFAMMRLRQERDLAKVQTLLALSRDASAYGWIAWVALGLTGVALTLATHTWHEAWIWGSALVLVATTLSMSPLAARAMNEARCAAGLAWFDGRGMQPAREPDPTALAEALEVVRRRALPVLAIGSAGLALLVWLMVARPA